MKSINLKAEYDESRGAKMKKAAVLFLLPATLLMYGCGSGSETPKTATPTATTASGTAMSKTDELKQKAKVAEAASLVGYDGKAIREDLNKIIDIQAEEAKRLEDLKDIR